MAAALSIDVPLTIGKDFAYVVLAAAGITLQCGLQSLPVMKLRRELKVEYPDMGSGRSAAKLSDEDWARFNNAQRAHYNYIESAAGVLSMLVLGGLYYPRFQSVTAIAYMIGRFMYGRGYVKSGSKGRYPGVLIVDVAAVTLLGTAVVGSLKVLGCF